MAFHVPAEQLQRIIDGLQEQALVVGEDRRDHIHQLRQIGDLDHIGMIDQRIQETGHHQRIFQIVMLFQDAAAALAVATGAIPDIPFVKGDIKLVPIARRLAGDMIDALGHGGIDQPGQGLDLLVHFDGTGDEIGIVIVWIADIEMDAKYSRHSRCRDSSTVRFQPIQSEPAR